MQALIALTALLAAMAALPAAAQMKGHGDMSMPMQATGTHKTTGVVNAVDAGAGTVNVTHEPIPSLKWPRMTMDLEVADKTLLKEVKPGMKVEFELGKKKAGGYAITAIRKAE